MVRSSGLNPPGSTVPSHTVPKFSHFSDGSAPVQVISAPDLSRRNVFTMQGLEKAIKKCHECQDDPVFCVRGFPADIVEKIGNDFDIDRLFVEAHATRTGYRPLPGPRKFSHWAHFEYPELVTGCFDEENIVKEGKLGALDVMDEPVVKPIDDSGAGAVFRRASCWRGDYVDILFLDKEPWNEPDSLLGKARRQLSVTKRAQQNPKGAEPFDSWVVKLQGGDEIPSLEQDFFSIIEQDKDRDCNIADTISTLAYHRWLELFEALPPPGYRPNKPTRLSSLLALMMQCLEQNADMARATGLSLKVGARDWEALAQRVQRRMDLLRRAGPIVAELKQAPDSGSPGKDSGSKATSGDTYDDNDPPRDWEEMNQRSLDRVTYLGGILLPVSVVSDVLGIEGRYGPEGTQFWVFWVAAAISSAICIFIIYLDQLRDVDAWFEISASDAIESMLHQPMKVLGYSGEVQFESMKESDEKKSGQEGPAAPQVPAWATRIPGVYANEKGGLAVGPQGQTHVFMSTTPNGRPTVCIQKSRDGVSQKAWRRANLGWGGAVKKTMGYYRLTGDGKVRFRRPDANEDDKTK